MEHNLGSARKVPIIIQQELHVIVCSLLCSHLWLAHVSTIIPAQDDVMQTTASAYAILSNTSILKNLNGVELIVFPLQRKKKIKIGFAFLSEKRTSCFSLRGDKRFLRKLVWKPALSLNSIQDSPFVLLKINISMVCNPNLIKKQKKRTNFFF